MAKQINDVFDNCSLAPIVLLDGSWGIGKTHFITHKYIKHYPEQDCLLISVLGIQSLQQFQEKLIGKYMSLASGSESDSATKAVSVFSKVLSTFGDVTNSSQLVESLSGLVKQSIISKINDVTIIVDDLERIEDPSLASLILGELYGMCNSERSIKAIVVMNDAKSSVSKSLIEKVICWKFKYEISSEDAFNIAFGSLNVSPDIQRFMIKRLDEIQPLNLRVLIRLCDRMKQVSRMLNTMEDEIDVESSKQMLFHKMIYLSFLHHQQDQDLDEIVKQINTMSMPNEPDERHPFYKQYIFHNESTSFIEFTLGCLSRPLQDSDLHNLHPKTNDLSDFIHAKGLSRYSDEEIEVKISDLFNYVSNEPNPSLSLWYSAVNFLAYLYSLGVSNDQRLSNIVNIALGRLEYITPSKERHFHTFSCDSGLPKSIDELRSYFEEKESKDNHTQLNKEIIKSKWVDVDSKAYTHVTNRQDPLTLEASDWLKAIGIWDHHDLELFWDFCLEVHRVSSLDHFFGKDNREKLTILLKSQLDSMTPCLRKGLLTRIYNLLSTS
ncbi:TPA: P-loop NTPase fold protein [Photobacterium damselae]